MKRKNILMLVSLCVAAVLLAAAAGRAVPAYAGGGVDAVEIVGLTEPVIGWAPDYYWEFATASPGCYASLPGAGAVWYESEQGDDYAEMATNSDNPADLSVFREGWYYRFVTEVRCDSSHVFAASPTVTVNGKPAEFKINGDVMTVTAYYGPLDYDHVVTYVNIKDFVPPADGAEQSYIFSIDPNCHVKLATVGASGTWYESSNGGLTYEELVTNGEGVRNFSKGHVYMFKTRVAPEEGYKLAGSISVSVNDGILAYAETGTFYSHELGKYADICMIFPLLNDDSLTIVTKDGSGSFFTYSAGKPIDAEVEVKNAIANVTVKWYYCGYDGTPTSDVIATGTAAKLDSLTSDDMMVPHFVFVKAEEAGTGRVATALIPYMLYPAGYEGEDDPGDQPGDEPTEAPGDETDENGKPRATGKIGDTDTNDRGGVQLSTGMIVMIGVCAALLCTVGVLVGILIGKKRK